MEQTVLFEEKLYLSPKDMNHISKSNPIDMILLKHLRTKLEGRCSKHGFVIPDSLEILSRSMGTIENGTYTGNIIIHVQTQGRVYNPVNGTRLVGTIDKHNKMGLYIIYKNSIRILIPRDLHIGNEEFDKLVSGDTVEIEVRKSRFQIHDPFILSVGVYIKRASSSDEIVAAATTVEPVTKQQPSTAEGKEDPDLDESNVEESELEKPNDLEGLSDELVSEEGKIDLETE